MSIARILLITLLISSAIVILALFKLESGSPDNESSDEVASSAPIKASRPETPKPVTPAAPNPAPPDAPDDNSMAPDEMENDEQYEKEQISTAMRQLSSTNEEERVEAVEQLGAYPSPETETILVQLLAQDSNAEVRNAAALSLGSMDEPSDGAIMTLMSALEDQSEDVRFSSLSTLEDYMLSQEEDSANYKRIREGLRQKSEAAGLAQDLRDSIKEILKDQESAGIQEPEPESR